MATFPNEQPIPPHDLINLAEEEVFTNLDAALQASNSPLSRSDFDFTSSNLNVASQSGVVIARPHSGQGDHWALEVGTNSDWLQNPSWDPNTNTLDTSTCPQPPAAPGGPTVIVSGPIASSGGIRMTGNPIYAPVDTGTVGKSDGKEFSNKLDSLFRDDNT